MPMMIRIFLLTTYPWERSRGKKGGVSVLAASIFQELSTPPISVKTFPSHGWLTVVANSTFTSSYPKDMYVSVLSNVFRPVAFTTPRALSFRLSPLRNRPPPPPCTLESRLDHCGGVRDREYILLVHTKYSSPTLGSTDNSSTSCVDTVQVFY